MFSQIVAAIQTTLGTIGAWTTTIAIGDQFVQEQGSPPRIVFTPASETFTPPTGPGGNPRPLWDRLIAVDVDLWGQTQDDTEGLIDQLIIAVHRTFKGTSTAPHARGGRYRVGAGRWVRDTNLVKYGFRYKLQLEFTVPVIDRDWTGTAATPPDASTYTGTQILTNQDVPPDTHAIADVAATLGTPPTDQGHVTVNVPKP